MKFTINIEKRFAYAIVGILVIALGVLIVWAYGTNNPVAMGHSAGEINVNIAGTTKTLQQAIDDGDFSGSGNDSLWSSGSGGDIYYNNGNVGIGTTSPSYKLDVSGSIRASSDVRGNRLCIGSDCRSSWPSGGSGGSSTPVQYGLYGRCYEVYINSLGSSSGCHALFPAYCTYNHYCRCPTGYSKVLTGYDGLDPYYSCYKN